MERITNYIRGNVRLRISCKYPERFLNICASSGVEFWDMKRQNGELILTTHYEDYRFLRKRAPISGYRIIDVRKTGTSFFLWRMRKRYALLIGMVLFLGLTWFSSFFIWEINISGNEKVSAAEIRSQLEELGVGIGTCRLTISQDRISNEMLLRIPELCWITVNTHGSRAEVMVREEIPTPEMVDEKLPTLVFAKKSGIIEKMTVLEGSKKVAVGDTVSEGDILISGEMESLSSGTRYVHGMGDVYARTWYTVSAQMPEIVGEKTYTGRAKVKHSLTFGKFRLNLYLNGGVSWEQYDKTTAEEKLKLFGTVLPFGIVTETYSEYSINYENQTELAEQMKKWLVSSLENDIDDGELVRTEFKTESKNGVVTVTLTAECLEQIGEMREMSEEEMIMTIPGEQ